MVQRKADACNKPSLNNLKPSSSLHHHHGKNNTRPDSKKRIVMKRSGPFKRQAESAIIEGDSIPNYMKSTSSFTAKKKNPRFKSTVKKRRRCPEVVVHKPTCSSTLRHRKFPNYLELSRGGTESSGTSVFKVCSYTYCSLNGHRHVPPLKLFLSDKRRSMKASSLRESELNNGGDELKEEENLIQDDAVEESVFSDVDDPQGEEEGCDMEVLERNMETEIYDNNVDFEYECSSQMNIAEYEFKGIECDEIGSQDSTFVDSDAFSRSSDDESESEVMYDPESLNDAKAQGYVETEPEEDPKQALDLPEDAISGNKHVPKPEEIVEMEPRANRDSKKPTTREDPPGDFKLRGPNFLPLEPDPDAEKVDLKHQEVDERRNSEEFMVDYALRQAVTKLAPARKRKVELLVQAFEKVLPAAAKIP